MQWVTLSIGDAIGLVEQALQEAFMTALFQGLREGTPGRGVTLLPVKQAGLALPDPTKKVPGNLCHHRRPRRSAQGPGGVPYGGQFCLPPRVKYRGAEEKRPSGRGGPLGDPEYFERN